MVLFKQTVYLVATSSFLAASYNAGFHSTFDTVCTPPSILEVCIIVYRQLVIAYHQLCADY